MSIPVNFETEKIASLNPRSGEAIGEFIPTETAELPEILRKARTAFDDWSSFSLKTRIELFKKAYREFYANKDSIARLISQETGKPLVEAYSSEILPVLDCFKYYLANIKKFLATQDITPFNPLFKLRRGYVRYEPIGVVAVISPWNYPFLLAMQHIIPAMLVGNVVIHKPSEYTTLTGLKIREIFDRAYLPKSVLSVVTGFAEVGRALVESDLDKIFFTGSTSVGQKIYESAARNLTPVNMELGGNDAMIVLPDADLERATSAAVWGAFNNCGQACVSVERLYVHESIMDVFVRRLVEKAGRITFANESCEGEVACPVNEMQFKKIKLLVEEAVENGAVVRLGGRPASEAGKLYFEPTVLTNVHSSMHVFRQEIFGPVVLVMPFLTDDEAVFMANDSQFGLSASVWTRNLRKGRALAERIEAGAVLINDLESHVAQFEAPYTGYKKSGLGVSHGPWGIAELVRTKYVNMDRPLLGGLLSLVSRNLATKKVWWFRYSEKHASDFVAFADFLHADSIWKRVAASLRALRALFRSDYL